jgi:hypothetical protein
MNPDSRTPLGFTRTPPALLLWCQLRQSDGESACRSSSKVFLSGPTASSRSTTGNWRSYTKPFAPRMLCSRRWAKTMKTTTRRCRSTTLVEPRPLDLARLCELAGREVSPEIQAAVGPNVPFLVYHGFTPFGRDGTRLRGAFEIGYEVGPSAKPVRRDGVLYARRTRSTGPRLPARWNVEKRSLRQIACGDPVSRAGHACSLSARSLHV